MFERIAKKVINANQLKHIRAKHKDKRIVFCTGCYDILQSGHAVFLNQCKEHGDILIVGVGRDSVITRLKGPGRPVNPENNRLYLVAALEDVNYAVLNDTELCGDKIDFKNILNMLRPEVFVLNDDDGGIEEKKTLCSEYNIELALVPRTVPKELEATSTTRIIDKINFKYRSPLRMDLSGGWTDVPYIMGDKKGYVSNLAIKPLIEYSNGQFNFSGYPRGSGLSTSTAVKLIELISSKNYNAESKSLTQISEDLFNLENNELNWAIGRQDQYSLVFGGFNCFEFGKDYAKPIGKSIPKNFLEEFKTKLLLYHTGVSRSAQSVVEQVYKNYKTQPGQEALDTLAECGLAFYNALLEKDCKKCAHIMDTNFAAQKKLAPATSNETIDSIYSYAKKHGALGGKIAGAGGGGAFIFICENTKDLTHQLKKKFSDSFEIDFEIQYDSIKQLNML